jgi:signal transduction histidine kinase
MASQADLPPEQLRRAASAGAFPARALPDGSRDASSAIGVGARGSTIATRTTSAAAVGHRKHALSLGTQMALASVVVALAAVLIVSLTTLLVVTAAFRQYQSAQLESQAVTLAQTIGNGSYFNTVGAAAKLKTFARQHSAVSIWIVDAYSTSIVEPTGSNAYQKTVFADDSSILAPTLQAALQGQSSTGALDDPAGFSPLNQRVYAVAPIYAAGGEEIVGALAVTTPPRNDRAAYTIFQTTLDRIILLSALGAALVAILAALLFARRMTRPLARLATAATRMAGGDYAARVSLRTADEYVRLAESFNDMAAALERDVNELQRQEHLRRELVANVSHELATPLTAISGFSEALLDGVVHQPQQREETVRLIARECARLRRLVDQLRQVARFEAGAQPLDRAPLQLAPLAEETLAVLQPELARKNVGARSTVPRNLPPVYADADRLTEVLLNLLDNALRHVQPGGEIELAAALDGPFVRVSIADDGPGISPGDRQRVFDRFYRADKSRSSATGGSGLGLAIVRALVEAHGGTIRVDERPGGGARFTFTLPVAMGARDPRAVRV